MRKPGTPKFFLGIEAALSEESMIRCPARNRTFQFFSIKRFADVIVRACIQPFDDLFAAIPGGSTE